MGSLTPSAVEPGGDLGFLATRVDTLINWGRKNSLWPMPLGLSCCGIELMAMIGPKFDLARFGAEAARFTPRQCDLLIVAGTLTWKMAQACRTIYDQMPDPKWVLAMGVCSSSGGMYDSYAVVQGVDSILPVDVYVPGCPPRPDAVIDAILKLQKKIEREDPLGRLTTRAPLPEIDEGSNQSAYQPNSAVARTRLDKHAHDPAARLELPERAPRPAPRWERQR
jgi:NADH-quinone oxidoreductase subunit B